MDRMTLEHILDQMTAAEVAQNDQEYGRQLQKLTRQPDEALNLLREVLREPDKDYWPAAIDAVKVMGYPRNASALPLIIEHAADPNSPASFGAIHLLEHLPQAALEGELVAAFWPISSIQDHQAISHDPWIQRANAACLVAITLGVQYCRILGPSLVFVLSQPEYRQQLQPQSSNEVLPWSLLEILETIKEDLIPYGIPALLDIHHEEKLRGQQGRVTALLRSLGTGVVEPYSKLATFDPTLMKDQPGS